MGQPRPLSSMSRTTVDLENKEGICILRLQSNDGTNRLTRECVRLLTDAVHQLTENAPPLVIAGNARFFSAGI